MMQKIESVQNETVKRACKLAVSAKFRQAEKAFFLEGARLCCDAAMSGAAVLQCFVTEDALRKESDRLTLLLDRAAQSSLITDAVAQKLSQTMSPQGVFCVCAMEPLQAVLQLGWMERSFAAAVTSITRKRSALQWVHFYGCRSL